MYLFEEVTNKTRVDKICEKVRVYELKPNPQKVKDYKKSEMNQIPKRRQVLMARTNYDKVLEKDIEVVSPSDLDFQREMHIEIISLGSSVAYFFHEMVASHSSIQKYYEQDEIHKTLELGSHTKDYLLCLNDKYRQVLGSVYEMDEVITIPYSLYLYERFAKQGLFELLTDDELKELLSLYSLSEPIAEYNLKVLKEIREAEKKAGINCLDWKLKNSERILRLLN